MENQSKFFEAIVNGNVADLKKTLELGAIVDSKNDEGQTALCIVAKCRIDLVQMLITNGANVNLPSDDLITPLHWAVEFDNEEIVEYLLLNGANTEVRDRLYETPLHWAGWTGHHKTAKIILKYGGDPNVKNNGGYTPLDLAKRQGHQKIIDLFEEYLVK